ncbi:MAG: hypothetical protein HXX16_08735 [Bacteroidales bacterium]|nr:hypothetical protein [Bacteroidales bacterium]
MKKRNLFMSTAIMCGLLCFAFKFDSNGIYWLWANSKPVVVILALASIVLGALWIRESRRIKTHN